MLPPNAWSQLYGVPARTAPPKIYDTPPVVIRRPRRSRLALRLRRALGRE